eukprot:1160554-Pelagomonas_calceolata.AAC.1
MIHCHQQLQQLQACHDIEQLAERFGEGPRAELGSTQRMRKICSYAELGCCAPESETCKEVEKSS